MIYRFMDRTFIQIIPIYNSVSGVEGKLWKSMMSPLSWPCVAKSGDPTFLGCHNKLKKIFLMNILIYTTPYSLSIEIYTIDLCKILLKLTEAKRSQIPYKNDWLVAGLQCYMLMIR